MKLPKFMLVCATAACLGAYSATPSQAAVIYYNGTSGNSNLDVSFSQGGNVHNQTGLLSLGSQSWIDPGGSTAETRYIGGTVEFHGSNGIYSSNISPTLHFTSSLHGNGNVGYYGDNLSVYADGSASSWTQSGPTSNGSVSNTQLPLWSITGGVSTTDVIYKLSKIAGTEGSHDGIHPDASVKVSIFLGANARAATEGVADYTFQLDFVQAIDQLNVQLDTNYTTANATLTTTNMFGADTWTAVGAVPEPATWALLAFSLTTVVVLRRR